MNQMTREKSFKTRVEVENRNLRGDTVVRTYKVRKGDCRKKEFEE